MAIIYVKRLYGWFSCQFWWLTKDLSLLMIEGIPVMVKWRGVFSYWRVINQFKKPMSSGNVELHNNLVLWNPWCTIKSLNSSKFWKNESFDFHIENIYSICKYEFIIQFLLTNRSKVTKLLLQSTLRSLLWVLSII